jgi:hypothetical protein
MSRVHRRWMVPVAAALLAAAPLAAFSELKGSLEYNETLTQIWQEYREALKPCWALHGEERAACRDKAEATRKWQEDMARAGHLEAQRETTAEAEADKEIESQHRLALARCDRLAPAEKASCRDVARARYGK